VCDFAVPLARDALPRNFHVTQGATCEGKTDCKRRNDGRFDMRVMNPGWVWKRWCTQLVAMVLLDEGAFRSFRFIGAELRNSTEVRDAADSHQRSEPSQREAKDTDACRIKPAVLWFSLAEARDFSTRVAQARAREGEAGIHGALGLAG